MYLYSYRHILVIFCIVFAFIMTGCTNKPKQIYVRSEVGFINGPFICEIGSKVRTETSFSLIADPNPGELETMKRLSSIIIPKVETRLVAITEAFDILNDLQREVVNNDMYVPISLVVDERWYAQKNDHTTRENTYIDLPRVVIAGEKLSLYRILRLIQVQLFTGLLYADKIDGDGARFRLRYRQKRTPLLTEPTE